MLSLCVSNQQVRFRPRRGEGHVTVLPVTVEFEKLGRGARMVSRAEWTKVSPADAAAREVASPTDLLHAVVALYNRCLPDVTVQSLYRTVCAEGTKTLLLLRDTSEILQEWESHHLPSSASQSREDSLGEINNNPALQKEGGPKERPEGPAEGNGLVGSPGEGTPLKAATPTPSLTEGHLGDDWRPWTPKNHNHFLERFRPSVDNSPVLSPLIQTPQKVRGGSEFGRDPPEVAPIESPFSDVFSDSGGDSDTGSDMDEDEEGGGEDFSRGLDAFLRAVASRKAERRLALDRYSLQSTHVGIEHRLLAAATFNKNYRIPGTRVVYLSLLTVRKRFRRCGIGKFMLKKLKSPSQVGPYDALVVRADASALNFFLKSSFTDDLILNSRFRELEIEGSPKGTLLSYLPPFDGHYPPLPGAQDWNSVDAVVAMDEEIDKWRQKSLESYQTQVTCLTRLQQEVLRLHNLLKRQDATIQFLKKENQRLQGRLTKVERKSAQALIDVLEKEAVDFERFCNIQYQSSEDR